MAARCSRRWAGVAADPAAQRREHLAAIRATLAERASGRVAPAAAAG